MTGHLLRVYFGLLLASTISVVIAVLMSLSPTEKDTAVVARALRGGASFATEQLNTTADREQTRLELERRFGYKVTILPPDPDRPPERSLWVDDSTFQPLYLNAVLESGEIVRFGRLPAFDFPILRILVGSLSLMLTWAFVAFILLRPQWRALRSMETAATRLAAGDWGTRLGDAMPEYARPVAQAFDRMAAEIEAQIAERRRMMQVVSHELRTPLTRLQFGVDLLADAESCTAREARIEGIFADIEALDELVDELQTFVQYDHPAPLKRRPFALAEALDALVDEARLDESIDLRRESLGADAPPLFAELRLFRRAIGNLLRNARRHATSRVEVTAIREAQGWRISVSDDGPGIAPADQSQVWQPFVRLNEEQGKGSGLGLAIVQRVIRDHGGSATIDTSPWGGARFTTTWPDSPAGASAQIADTN